MRRFTFAPERLADGRVVFDRDETHHLARVLRLRPGDTVVASSGDGLDHTIRIESLGDAATGTVIGTRARVSESPLDVTLLQGVPKGDKMEAIVRMATELGVRRILPVLTERTIVRLEPARWRERARRWQRVAKEATKQCGRALVPDVELPRPLDACLDALPEPAPREWRLCVWEGATAPLGPALDAAAVATCVYLFVGPEGGLAAHEVDTAARHGFTVATLGPRVLRTETAGPIVIGVLQYRLGDLS